MSIMPMIARHHNGDWTSTQEHSLNKSGLTELFCLEVFILNNAIKKILLAILGFLQGTLGSYLALLGWAFAFPETSPGAKDYEEDMFFVPFGYIMMLNGNNYKFGDDGFTKVEKEIAKIIEKNFSQDKADSFE